MNFCDSPAVEKWASEAIKIPIEILLANTQFTYPTFLYPMLTEAAKEK